MALLEGPWGVWTGLTAAATLGLWSERTRLGKELSGALVATLVGLACSSTGLMPSQAPEYGVVTAYLLPLAIPLLLLGADLRQVVGRTGRLLHAFLLGSLATLAGTVVATLTCRMTVLGEDAWKLGAALCARHIGGAVNYVGTVEALGVSPSVQAAGLTADNLVCALYFMALYALARTVPPDAATGGPGEGAGAAGDAEAPGIVRPQMQVVQGSTALALAAALCHAGQSLAARAGYPGASIPAITLLTVIAASVAPRALRPLVASGEALAAVLLQVFFASVGVCGDVRLVAQSGPSILLFCLVQVGVHLGLILLLGRLWGIPRKEVLLASNANVGGPTTAAGMCSAKGWRTAMVPSILVGTLGYAIATFVSILLGLRVLKPLAGGA